MADKYYDMGAMQAFYDKIKSLFQTVANKVTSWSNTPSDDKYPTEKLVKTALDDCRTIPQDISKGANLVVNGSGRMSSNYNFSGFLYIPTIANGGSAGSFGFSATTAEDEYISCDFNKKIVFSADIKNLVVQPSNCVHRIFVYEFDIDKKSIVAANVMFGVGTLTELTQDLNPGDTVVHFADLSNANWKADNAYQRGFIFWNYINSYGYLYPPETYSQNVYIGANSSALYENTNVDATNGTITLNSAWSGPAIPAGTKVSRRQSGSAYPYPATITTEDTEWHSLKGSMQGIIEPGTSSRGLKFSQGTAFIRVGMYPSNLNNTDTTTGKRAVIANLAVYEEEDINDGFGTLPVNRGGTGATTAIAAEYNILNQVADIDITLNDDRKIALCNQTKSASDGVFRWIKLSNVWTYIKSKLSSDSTVSIDAYNDIGGRNLLSNTKISATHFTRVDNTASYKGAAFTFDGTDADSFFSLGFLESIATGETVTFSCDVSGLNEANNEYISFSLAALTSWSVQYKINKNGHASFVITRTGTSEIVPGTTNLTIDDGRRFASTAPSGFTISNIKLERGAVSTSYTKHPAEDPKGIYYIVGSSDYVAYSSSSTYTATSSSGPFTSENSCIYGGKAYFCKTTITTPEAWTSAHWTAIATPVLTGTIDGLTSLYAGLKIAYKMPITGGTSSTYLNINNLGNKYIRRNDSNLTTHLPANTVVFLAYDGTYWRWADYDYAPNNWVTTMGAYCETAAGTQAKTATSTNTVYTAGEAFLIRIVNANTYNGKITLNINGQGAKDVWINGAISSSSNKTLPAGEHWCYYDGSVFHIWTDGTAQFKKLKAESFIGNLSGTATSAAGYTNDGAIATALGNKQDDLGISSSGDTTKFLNEKGQWATPTGTAQVQADWDQTTTTAVDYIKNKPNLDKKLGLKGDDGTVVAANSDLDSFTSPGNYFISSADIMKDLLHTPYKQLGLSDSGKTGASHLFVFKTTDSGRVTQMLVTPYPTAMSSSNAYGVWLRHNTVNQSVVTWGNWYRVASDTDIPKLYSTTSGQNTDGAPTQAAVNSALSSKADTSSLATVATSGSYSDLTNTPNISKHFSTYSGSTAVYGFIIGDTQTLDDGTSSIIQGAFSIAGGINSNYTPADGKDRAPIVGFFSIWARRDGSSYNRAARLYTPVAGINDSNLQVNLKYIDVSTGVRRWVLGFGTGTTPQAVSFCYASCNILFDRNADLSQFGSSVTSAPTYATYFQAYKSVYIGQNDVGIGTATNPTYIDSNGRVQACDFDEAYKSITQLGQSGTGYDTTTTVINSTNILQATQNSYVVNIKRLKIGLVYKFMFLEGSNSGQVYLCNGNGSNFTYASGPNGGTTKKLSLNGGAHGSSYTSYIIRDGDTSVYHIWGY